MKGRFCLMWGKFAGRDFLDKDTMPAFRFKRFSVEHERSTMKVGTDGVLLGAWASLPERPEIGDGLAVAGRSAEPLGVSGGTLSAESPRRFLDVGCGCGLIALMLAQRLAAEGWKSWEARVDALDLDAASFEEALSNTDSSRYREYLSVSCLDYRDLPDSFPARSYSRIVSNPPYFRESLKCPKAQRNQARHADTLPFEELLSVSERLLEPGGRLCLILPPDSWECVQRLLPEHAPLLELCRLARVFSKPGKACERVMAEWVRREEATRRASHQRLWVLPKEESALNGMCLNGVDIQDILIHDEAGGYTEEYRALVKGFYFWA